MVACVCVCAFACERVYNAEHVWASVMSSMSIQVSKIDIPLANGLNAKLDVYIIALFDLDGYLS